jgi:ribosome-binding protein aMBF1 (putative translation factor)
MICEVCGSEEQAAEMNMMDDHLHVCANCINDRRQSDDAAPEWEEEQ